jgi:hypothetical protein
MLTDIIKAVATFWDKRNLMAKLDSTLMRHESSCIKNYSS